MKAIALLLIVLAGCKGEEKKATPGNPAGSDLGGMAMGSNPPGVIPEEKGPKYDCAAVVPQAIRDKFFANYKFQEPSSPKPLHGECGLEGPTPGTFGRIVAHCNPVSVTKEARDKNIETMLGMLPNAKKVEGIGLAAVQGGTEAAMSLNAYSETCFLTVVAPKGVDPVAVAKELLPLLPPK